MRTPPSMVVVASDPSFALLSGSRNLPLRLPSKAKRIPAGIYYDDIFFSVDC